MTKATHHRARYRALPASMTVGGMRYCDNLSVLKDGELHLKERKRA
jgi:hypothetical protein